MSVSTKSSPSVGLDLGPSSGPSKGPRKGTHYGFLYYFATWHWFFWRGMCDAMGNSFDNIYRRHCCFLHRQCALLPDNLKDKTVVITGANRGIGKETASVCARLGARVILACRDQTKAQETVTEILSQEGVKPEQLLIVPLDLTSLASVRACAKQILSQTTQIDVLVNNGGIMMCPHWKSADGFEYQFAVNYLGHFLLTNLLLPKLKAAPEGARIVNVASLTWFIGSIHFENINLEGNYHPIRAYCQSKLAQMLFTRELAKKLKAETGPSQAPITVYALHPGMVRTGLTVHLPWYQRAYFWAFGWMIMATPQLGAQTTLHCAFNAEAGRESGFYYENCRKLRKVPAHGRDEDLSARLWNLSVKLCDL